MRQCYHSGAGAEIFTLRKLLPMGPEFTFNIHVMDFQPGEHLIVKEVHYNQHGLVLLQVRPSTGLACVSAWQQQ